MQPHTENFVSMQFLTYYDLKPYQPRDKVKVVIQQHRDRSQEVRKTPFCLKFADFVKLGLFFNTEKLSIT